jgi:serine/threonine protein kinase
VALKRLKKLGEPGYDIEKYWMHEAFALMQIRNHRQLHLTRSIAAIHRGSDYYIMFQWANGGSLREFWRRLKHVPKDPLEANHVMRFLEEFVGLAQALSALHDTNTNTKTSLVTRAALLAAGPAGRPPVGLAGPDRCNHVAEASPPPRAPNLALPVIRIRDETSGEDSCAGAKDIDRSYRSENDDATDEDCEDHWRHGDLNPDNILQFRHAAIDSHSWMGTLKIAGLGLAKQHIFAKRQRNAQTSQTYTISQYEAPEAIADNHLYRSRRYDVWSMACVIFEFVIVLLYGYKGLNTFYNEKEHIDQATDTLYFNANKSNNTAKISNIFSHWAEKILNDPECQRHGGSVIADVVKLVRDRLLVVDVPREDMTSEQIQSCRHDAATLYKQLHMIREKAESDKKEGGDYLASKLSREGISVPQPSVGIRLRRITTGQSLGDTLKLRPGNMV